MTEVDELLQKVPSDPGQVLERVAFLRQYLDEHPDSALAWAMLGASSYMYLHRGEALQCYERAHELEPNELGWLWGIAQNTNHRANPSPAFEVLRRLPLIPVLFDQFERELNIELGAESIPLLKQRVLLDPLNPSNWSRLGWCLFKQDLKDEARAAFVRASQQLAERWGNEAEPDHPMGIVNLIKFADQGHDLAWGYWYLGDVEDCVREARQALAAWRTVRWAPRNQERRLLSMLEEHQCHEEVAQCCEVAFTVENWYCGSFLSSYVWALVGLDKLEEALDFYRTRRCGRPDDEDWWYASRELAVGLRTAGRLDEARQVLEEGNVEAPTAEGDLRPLRDLGPELWLELAKVRDTWGDAAGAAAARERAAKAVEEAKG